MAPALLLVIAIFLTIFGIAYTYLTYQNRERLALINAGLSPDTFKNVTQGKGKFLLVFGLVFIGFSFGVIGGFILEKYLLVNYNPRNFRHYPQAYFAMVALWLGIAMVISFYISRKSDKQ